MANTRSSEPITLADLLTTAQVARLLGRGVRTVHRMVGTGRLPATRVPGYKGPLLFAPADVEQLRAELSESPPAAASRAS